MVNPQQTSNGNDHVGETIVRVTVISGPHLGKTALWGPGTHVIGRSESSDLNLQYDLTVSPEHCRIEILSSGCRMTDLNSRSGVLLNGQPTKSFEIRHRDRIRVGMSELLIDLNHGGKLAETIDNVTQLPSDRSKIESLITTRRLQGLLDIPGLKIIRKIGQGGMGVVYEATECGSQTRVAVKTLVPHAGSSPKSIKLFHREMSVLSKLTHPNIVRFLSSGEYAGQIYLVMEYIENVNLAEIVRQFNPNQRLRAFCGIICQVLSALEFAHSKKHVHRDVKPQNILIERKGNRFVAKLADFGLAKNFEQAGLSQLTGDDEVRGTPAFMPWEQIQNSRYSKPTVDIYSTAATLYFFLTGKPPGHTDAAKQSLDTVSALLKPFLRHSETTKPNREYVQGLAEFPSELSDILNQALQYSPSRRFGSAHEMRESLLRFCRNLAVAKE